MIGIETVWTSLSANYASLRKGNRLQCSPIETCSYGVVGPSSLGPGLTQRGLTFCEENLVEPGKIDDQETRSKNTLRRFSRRSGFMKEIFRPVIELDSRLC